MSKHLRIYDQAFGINKHNPRRCELTGATRGIHIHHIEARGMGGRQSADTPDNLMAIQARWHELFGDNENWNDLLQEAHNLFMETRCPLVETNPRHILMQKIYQELGSFSTKA